MSAYIQAATRMIPLQPGTCKFDPTQRAFTGFDVGPFFVHSAMSDDGVMNVGVDAFTWHVSHRATGLSARQRIPTHARAIWLARKLAAFDCWDGDTKEAVHANVTPEIRLQFDALFLDATDGDCQGEIPE